MQTWLHDNVDSNAAQASQEYHQYRDGRNLQASSAPSSALTAGTAATLHAGYWLVAADVDGIGTGEYGTSPILVVVGGSPATVTTKGAAPTVDKHVLENSSGAWQKQADATVGNDLFWRLEATVPAGSPATRRMAWASTTRLPPASGSLRRSTCIWRLGMRHGASPARRIPQTRHRRFGRRATPRRGMTLRVELDADEYATSYATSRDVGATSTSR